MTTSLSLAARLYGVIPPGNRGGRGIGRSPSSDCERRAPVVFWYCTTDHNPNGSTLQVQDAEKCERFSGALRNDSGVSPANERANKRYWRATEIDHQHPCCRRRE